MVGNDNCEEVITGIEIFHWVRHNIFTMNECSMLSILYIEKKYFQITYEIQLCVTELPNSE